MKIRIFLRDLNQDSDFLIFKNPSNIFHYLSIVLRSSVGEEVFFFNKSFEYKFLIDEVDKKQIKLKNSSEIIFSNEKLKDISLIVPLIKPDKLNLIAKQAVEIGVKFLCITRMNRSSVQSLNLERLLSNITEALEQSGGYNMPEIIEFKDLKSAIDSFMDYDIFYGSYMSGSEKKITKNSFGKTCLIVGPEGGFSEEETTLLSKFTPLKIGNRILRTETATTAMMTVADFVTV